MEGEEAQPEQEPRVKSGIPGLDKLVGGGFVRNSVILVGGDTGTGKTIFGLQYIYKGIREYGENGLYISFAETKEMIERTASLFRWDLKEQERKDRFLFVLYQPKDVMEIVAEGGGTIRDTIEAFSVRRVVLDPLTSFSIMFETPYKEQQHLIDLFGLLHDLQCTTLVISEEPASLEAYKTNRAEFLSDGIVHLYNIFHKGARVRAVEIVKMRDSAIMDAVCPLRIDRDGITVDSAHQIYDL